MNRRSPFNRLSMHIMGEKSSALDLARGRIALIVALFMLMYIVVAARLVDATIIQGFFRSQHDVTAMDKEREHQGQVEKTRRADIVDRNGILLATSLKTASLYADPKLILDPLTTARLLSSIFPDLTYGETLRKLQDHKRFVWIKRNLTPDEQKKILEIGEPGLAFSYDYRRFYPQGALTAHMVGYNDVDGKGLAGIERSFNRILVESDKPIALTLDVRLQHILRREIQKAISDFTARAGAGIIMDANTGEVLAAVSLPDFNPQNPDVKHDADAMFNRVTLGTYEMGSIFKIFSAAALLDKTTAKMSRTYDTLNPLQRYGYKISDYHPEKHPLSVPEIFMHSSNIGTVLMAETVGTRALLDFFSDLGLTRKVEFEIGEVGAPYMPRPMRELNILTSSYGHGIAVTLLQVTAAVGTIVNGGLLVKPTMIKSVPAERKEHLRVLKKETSLRMRQLLRLVVTDGTGSKADVPGYNVGGKTGTADKNFNGRYVPGKRISSFIGVFPVDDPKYVITVMVDEPNPNKGSYGYATAGWVAAPAIQRIVTAMGPLLNIEPAENQTDIAEPLRQYISVKAEEH